MVLWLSAALGAIALSVSITVRTEMEHTSAVTDGLRAHYLATGSLDRAIQWILWGASARNPDGTARFWDRTKPRMFMSYPSGEAVVEMISESSKLNVRQATEAELLKVVTALTGDPARANGVVAGIVAWRSGQLNSSPGSTFQAPPASLQEIEELLFVPGVTPELFYGNYVEDGQGRLYARGGLRDCLSVWGTRGNVDANGAVPAVLEAVGMNPSDAAQLVRARAAKPFENISDVQKLGIPITRLQVNGGTMWTIRATARLRRPGGPLTETVRSAAVVVKYWDDPRQHPSPVQVLRYYGDAWSEFGPASVGVTQ